MSVDVEFGSLWQHGGAPPDLFVFLRTRRPADARDWLAVLLVDQRHRWQTPHPYRVEDYLAALPDLPAGVDWKRELAVGEAIARHATDRPLSKAEADSRFPEYTDTLRDHLRTAPAPAAPPGPSPSGVFSSELPTDSRVGKPPLSDAAVVDGHRDLPHPSPAGEGVSIPTISRSDQSVRLGPNGRYRVLQQDLGEGAFGSVRLALDEKLQKRVAIKTPNSRHIADPQKAKRFEAEARTVAKLRHPNIVTVYDLVHDNDEVFIVSDYIEGCNLREKIKGGRPNARESAVLIATLARALHHAHEKQLIHRDVKPENILIEQESGTPFLADFGLAIRNDDYLQMTQIAGTPAYMSPEQAGGEGHRLDGRSDLFSLGTVFYELLTGECPFYADTQEKARKLVTSATPRVPREMDATIDPELERICLKLLSKRASDRYISGMALAKDLEAWLAPHRALPPAALPNIITPRGLCSFTADDADFFLDLLPGLRNRAGLPESVAFWKERIEDKSSESTFSVGLLYGPSGCGKSSLVKAGLIPNLSTDVIAIYVEATSDDTETRLARALRRQLPGLPQAEAIVETLAWIRENGQSKVILVLDQFEQWLHAHSGVPDAELVRALRQCDGGRLQALLMIRDDFFGSVTRLMEQLDVPIVLRHNSAMVDLFSPDHAERVLVKFGQAYGRLPSPPLTMSDLQQSFIRSAIAGLAENGKVISVRLSLFADMVHDKPWEPATLEQVGGISGVGVTFLEETFSRDARYKRHLPAVLRVLRALLPGIDTEIKGGMRSASELRTAASYDSRPAEFEDLLRILDGELRLISPTEAGEEQLIAGSDSANDSNTTHRFYQLTHDYLVPSLREWLTRKQRETPRGRAELKLEERAAIWGSRGEDRQLPSLLEYLTIRRRTDARQWTPTQQRMMSKAQRLHAWRAMLASVATVATLAVVGYGWSYQHASSLVEQLRTAGPTELPRVLRDLDQTPRLAGRLLAPLLSAGKDSPDQRRAQLALVARDRSHVGPLSEWLLTAKESDIGAIRERLRPYADELRSEYEVLLRSESADVGRRFRAGLALADYVPATDDAIWLEPNLQFLAKQLVVANSEHQPELRKLLLPLREPLLPCLEERFGNATLTAAERLGAANALADYAEHDSELHARLLSIATPEQHAVIYRLLAESPSPEALTTLASAAQTQPPEALGPVERISHGQQRSNAAATLLRLGQREAALRVFEMTDDPEALTQFIFRCKPRGITAEELLVCLDLVQGEPGRYPARVRYALLLALGEFPLAEIPEARRAALLTTLAGWYRDDPSSGVHGASGWLLRHWGQDQVARQVDETAVPYSEGREWFTLAIPVKSKGSGVLGFPRETRQTFYYTFIVFPAGDYEIGSVPGEPAARKNEKRHAVRLTRAFAVLDREVTMEELIAFRPYYAGFMQQTDAQPSDAGFAADWYDSVGFCRWLGQQSRLSESDQAYAAPESLDEEKYPREPNPDANWAPQNWPLDLSRRGFRLPTEAEWEVAAGSGVRTAYGYGSDVSLLRHFGWFVENSEKRVHSPRGRRPSLRGLFDMHGNVLEWTHDYYGEHDTVAAIDPVASTGGSIRVSRGGSWDGDAASCRTAFRFSHVPALRTFDHGFRLALSSPFGVSSPAEQVRGEGAEPASGGTEEQSGAATTVP